MSLCPRQYLNHITKFRPYDIYKQNITGFHVPKIFDASVLNLCVWAKYDFASWKFMILPSLNSETTTSVAFRIQDSSI